MADEVVLTSDKNEDNLSISVWDLHTGMQVKCYKGGVCASHGISLTGMDHVFAGQFNKPIIHVWVIHKEQVQQKMICPGKVTSLAVTPDGVYCAVACGEKIYIWEIGTGNLLVMLTRHYQSVTCLKFTDNGAYLISAGDDNLAIAWNMAQILSSSLSGHELTPTHVWSSHSLPITDIHCGVGGARARVITSSLDHSSKMWDLSSGHLICSFIFECGISSVVMDNAEYRLFAGGFNGKIYQINLFSQNLDHQTNADNPIQFIGHSKQINCLAVSMDGTMLVSGSSDGTARVWHVSSHQCLRIVNHKGPVNNCQIVQKPINLETHPSKSLLSIIKPFKRQLHTYTMSSGESSADSHQTSSLGDVPLFIYQKSESESDNLEFLNQTPFANQASNSSRADFTGNGQKNYTKEELQEQIRELRKINEELYHLTVQHVMNNNNN